MRTFMLMLVLVGAPALCQDYKLIPGKKLFMEKMANDLDFYIKAEFVKQKVSLQVVGTPDEADYIMVGAATDEERRKWHEGWLTVEKDKTSGSVSIVDKNTKSLLWAGEAGDRNFWWGSLARGGHRKVASRLVKHLKPYIKK